MNKKISYFASLLSLHKWSILVPVFGILIPKIHLIRIVNSGPIVNTDANIAIFNKITIQVTPLV